MGKGEKIVLVPAGAMEDEQSGSIWRLARDETMDEPELVSIDYGESPAGCSNFRHVLSGLAYENLSKIDVVSIY